MPEQQIHDETKWFYEKDGKRHGEVSASEIRLLVKTNQIGRKNLLWRNGMEDWIPVDQTDFRTSLSLDLPPPLTGAAVSNTVVWVIAFAPFISGVIEFMIGINSYDDEDLAMLAVQEMEYFYIPLLLNIALCLFDERRLRDAGHDTAKFKGWIWLVPVYLYQRANNLKQGKSYFWIWIVMFIIFILAR